MTKSSGANSLLVRKIGNKGYYDNFINYLPIEEKERVIYKLRFLKLAEKALWLGLGTKAAFGDITNQSEVCLYSCWNGDLWDGRAMRKTGIQTGTGEELHLLTDRLKNKIAFLKQGRVIAEIDIPSNIGSKNLFLFLQIRDIDDEV